MTLDGRPMSGLPDVQFLAGHSSLQTTQRYIEGDAEASQSVVNLV